MTCPVPKAKASAPGWCRIPPPLLLTRPVAGADIAPSHDNYKDVLKRVAQNLGIQMEEVKESSPLC